MIPDLFEAITAYRAFDVHPNGLLVGQAHAEPWPPYQPFVARCGAVSGQGFQMHINAGVFVTAPVLDCDCGIYSLKTMEAAKRRVVGDDGRAIRYSGIDGRAWGEVKIWGRVIEHEFGWRSEFAYPSSLKCEDRQLAALIAQLYGVPCAVETIDRPRSELGDLVAAGPIGGGGPYYYLNRASFAFWRNQSIVLTSSGVIISSGDDAADTPMVHVPQPRVVAPPSIVAANRWQRRQYAKQLSPRDIQQADWRQILRDGLFASSTRGLTLQ